MVSKGEIPRRVLRTFLFVGVMALWLQKAGFQVAGVLALKISRPSSIICFNNNKKECKNVTTQLEGALARGPLVPQPPAASLPRAPLLK